VGFSDPTFVNTRAPAVADHLFPSPDRRLNLRPLVIAGGFLSGSKADAYEADSFGLSKFFSTTTVAILAAGLRAMVVKRFSASATSV
jgi:hypothetical protein